MKYKKVNIKNGIDVHLIKTSKFKTDLISVFITTPLVRENVTKNAIIPMILRKGSNALDGIDRINKELEEMYGAEFNCGVEKTGDNQILKFYLETIDDKYLPNSEKLLSKGITYLLDLVFNPKIENNAFKEEYVRSEKENLKAIIEGRKDNKSQYAYSRCQEEMYKGKPFGLYQYGYVEDIENMNAQNLYDYYKELIKNSKIDIFISGNIEEAEVINELEKDKNILELNERNSIYEKGNILPESTEKEIIENMEVTQGNLILGLLIEEENKREKYVAVVYNAILGGSATSKMFQIVREKYSLAYTAGSSYLRHKNTIFVRCGIEIENYQKTLDLIKKQLKDMQNGVFTDEDIQNSKTGIISVIRSIPEEQDTSITYYLGQELSGNEMTFEEYEEQIKSVTREEIINFASKVKLNTVYFLRN